jgi:hypothetical protein
MASRILADMDDSLLNPTNERRYATAQGRSAPSPLARIL